MLKVSIILEYKDGFLWIIERFEVNAHNIKHISFWNIHTQEILTFDKLFGKTIPFKLQDTTQIRQKKNINFQTSFLNF
jgi:hypothetical protein